MIYPFVFIFLAPYKSFFYYVFLANEYISIMYFLYLSRVSSKIYNIFFVKIKKYLLNRSHDFLLTFCILKNFNFLKDFSQILLILLSNLFLNNFFHRIKVIILENIIFKVFQLLVTKGTTMMTIDRLLNTAFAIYMPASCNVTIIDRIHAYCTLELGLKLL